MTSLSAVAAALRTAADTVPITLLGESVDAAETAASLLANATAGTSDPETAAAVGTFTDAYQQANDLLIHAITLRADLHALADRLAARTTPEPPPPPHPPDRIDQLRRSLPPRPSGSEAQGRWLGPGTDVTVVRSGTGDEWHDKALAFVTRVFGPRTPETRLARHVEVKIAIRMREERRTSETLVIDRQVCGRRPFDRRFLSTCDKTLKYILPPGATLEVVEHDGTRVVYRGEP